MSVYCKRCGRKLTLPASIKRQMGLWCYKKEKIEKQTTLWDFKEKKEES
ncbi:MAG: hypothetical protein HWN65_08385 [Candidatus Helarchaeota archaeon]|nr:hypothetical protein [Candidatus Helarchaeota archaeon]